jgi:hypothetical protein
MSSEDIQMKQLNEKIIYINCPSGKSIKQYYLMMTGKELRVFSFSKS